MSAVVERLVVTGARRAARAARSPARSAVTDSAACSGGEHGLLAVPVRARAQRGAAGVGAGEQQRAVRGLGGRGEAGRAQRLEHRVERRAADQHGRREPAQAQRRRAWRASTSDSSASSSQRR